MQEYKDISDILVHFDYCCYRKNNLTRDDAYIILDRTYVQTGINNDYNQQFCEDHLIPIIKLQRPGGTLIFFEGDFAYGHYGEDAQEFTIKWRDYLVKCLEQEGLKPTVTNNDILIGNNKITGTVVVKNKMALGFISIHPNADLIHAICLKPSNNQFLGLGFYGINAEKVAGWFRDFGRKY